MMSSAVFSVVGEFNQCPDCLCPLKRPASPRSFTHDTQEAVNTLDPQTTALCSCVKPALKLTDPERKRVRLWSPGPENVMQDCLQGLRPDRPPEDSKSYIRVLPHTPSGLGLSPTQSVTVRNVTSDTVTADRRGTGGGVSSATLRTLFAYNRVSRHQGLHPPPHRRCRGERRRTSRLRDSFYPQDLTHCPPPPKNLIAQGTCSLA